MRKTGRVIRKDGVIYFLFELRLFQIAYPPVPTENIQDTQQQQSTNNMIKGIISLSACSSAALFTSFLHNFVNDEFVLSFAFSALDALALSFTSLHTRLGTLKSLGIRGSERM